MSNQEKEKFTPLDLLKNSDFISYFKRTKKFKEIFVSPEAFYSYAFSGIVSALLVWMFKIDPKKFIDFANDFVGVLIGGYFGLLGFIIGAVAIILGLINNLMINNMQKIDKFSSFINLCFMYAFTALQNLWVIAELILIKIIVNIPLELITDLKSTKEIVATFFIFFILVHLPTFNLIYATYLVKVSLELLFIKYLVEERFKKPQE
ncbi:hypothetical protein ADM98_08530 [Exiguobacterium sp. BMC-KP]|uniref:hypothetical protein n=1 Tax=Exiguobacterium sp. BMC-KP TaxID=1684312 RepID=UPI0006AA2A44|nr:hypothetical protein [Exiguobacterium sp. BMC-KP]KOP28959.1 hypothetical protein ADM98_08530 [Exiguobacterium sp. BMC-KP]